MKIGVLSDTHIPVSVDDLPKKVYDMLKECDMIVHAGDIVSMSLIKKLEKIAETVAVSGNMDPADVRKYLPEKKIFTAEGKKIGVFHGTGAASKILDTMSKAFGEKLDVIIFGHSHNPYNEEKGGTLYFNPGSPTDSIFAPYRSIGMIEIENGEIKGEIIRLD